MKKYLIGQNVFVNNEIKATVLGVYLAKKYPAVKQLHCKLLSGEEFCLSLNGATVDDTGVHVQKLRACLPCDYVKLTRGVPIYDEKGVLQGVLSNVEVKNGVPVSFIGQNGIRYPYSMLKSAADALILKKKPTFPLGEPIHSYTKDKNAYPFVSKKTLTNAIKKGELVKLTLSLSPFELYDAL